MRVSNPPAKPLLIFDGECHFCRRWIERWREQTGERIEYQSSQETGSKYPEIPAAEFEGSVVLVTPSGQAYRGAEAVFRSLEFAPGRRWLLAAYEKVPLFAATTEAVYSLIARNRGAASAVSRALWGADVRRPTYFVGGTLFLRSLGLVYLIAFVSLWIQVDGLIGARGILPAEQFFTAVRARYGWGAAFAVPSLCWFNASNGMLHALCALGSVAAIVLTLGFMPVAALITCFIGYLSLTIAGQSFLSFQWDILLLETGFLAIFAAPLQWRLTTRREAPVSRVSLFLLKLLLFKLMFMSGVVKLTSGDDCWWNLTALDYHYWSQPLPTVFAWFADQHPEWFKKFSVAFCLVVEIVVPFFIWAPRRLRVMAAILIVLLQFAIAITGNYCFFNLLTIALCFLLIDDTVWGGIAGLFGKRIARTDVIPGVRNSGRYGLVTPAVLVITLPLNLWLMWTAIKPETAWPPLLATVYQYVEPFRIVNGYGLFRVMTKERPEIQIEGSADGIDWKTYTFKWKPGDVQRAPRWNAPHQPRLDWQMWFAALAGRREEIWFDRFMLRLLENEPAVTGLLEQNPFANSPPQYVRGILFKYQFTTADERQSTGAWWKRREVGEFFPEVSLRDFAQ